MKKFLFPSLLIIIGLVIVANIGLFSTLESCEERVDKNSANLCSSCFCNEDFSMKCVVDDICILRIQEDELQHSINNEFIPPLPPENLNIFNCQLDEFCGSFYPVGDNVLIQECFIQYIGSDNCITKKSAKFKTVCDETITNNIYKLDECANNEGTDEKIDEVALYKKVDHILACNTPDTFVRYINDCEDLTWFEKIVGWFQGWFK